MGNSAAASFGPCTQCPNRTPTHLTWGHCATCWAAVVRERSARMQAGPTALYRLYDTDENLLYIGTTTSPEQRWKDHRKKMPWWPDVDHSQTRIEWLDHAHGNPLHAEHDAIRAELPWYNRTGFGQDEHGNDLWPNLPPGCPPQPWYTHRQQAEYRPLWKAWRAVHRDCMLNPEERAALGW